MYIFYSDELNQRQESKVDEKQTESTIRVFTYVCKHGKDAH